MGNLLLIVATIAFRPRAALPLSCALALLGAFGVSRTPQALAAWNSDQPIQIVWVRQYYTLFLEKSTSARGALQPYARCLVYMQFRNWGPARRVSMSHGERPNYPNIRFRIWRNQVPIPVRRIVFPGVGASDYYSVPFDRGESVRMTYEYVEKVMNQDPVKKVDVFEDTWGFRGFRPPLEDWWIAVDLGQMYSQYQVAPGFGESTGPPALRYDRFFNRIFRVTPLGYRSRGTQIWWHFQNVGEERMHSFPKLRVEWQAWYR